MRATCAAIALIAALSAVGDGAGAGKARVADASARTSPAVAIQTGPNAAAAGSAAPETLRALPSLDGCRWIPEAPAAPATPPRFTVIDLWGPWSSDSMTYMPRLSRIARERAADGVVVRGITREMPGYPAERIEESIRRLGGRITYPIGIAPADLHAQVSAVCSGASGGPSTNGATAGAGSAIAGAGSADRDTTLVVDAAGMVAATCTPAELEHVLSRMIAGTWTGPHEIDAFRRETRAMDSLVKISMSDPALAASQVEEMVAMHPHRMRDFASRRIVILLRAGRADEAAAAMRAATDEWTRLQDSAELTALATLWMDSRVNSTGRDLRMAAEAAEAAATISGDLDPNPWLLLMRAQVAAGDAAGARAAGEKAMAIGDERMRGRIAQLLAKIPQQPEAGDGAQQHPK